MLKRVIRSAPVFVSIFVISCGAPKQQLPEYKISNIHVSDFYNRQISKQVSYFNEYLKLCSPSFNSTKEVKSLSEEEKNYELKKYFICCKYLKEHLEIISSVLNQNKQPPVKKGGSKNATSTK